MPVEEVAEEEDEEKEKLPSAVELGLEDQKKRKKAF